MTASQKPKTPSMTMKVRPGTSAEDVDIFCKRASRLTLSQVVDNVVVKERLTLDGEAQRRLITVEISLFPQEEYEVEHDVEPIEILRVFTTKFPLTLKKEMQSEMKKLDADLKSQIAELGKGKKVKKGGDDADDEPADDDDADAAAQKKGKDDDEQSEVGDGDADDAKHARQKQQQATYESDESDEDMEDEAYDDAAIEAAYASDGEGNASEKVQAKKSQKTLEQETKIVADIFMNHLHQASSFEFDATKCTFQLEVRPFDDFILTSVIYYNHHSSLGHICRSYCLWGSLNVLVAQL